MSGTQAGETEGGPGDPGARPTTPASARVRRGLRARLFAWSLAGAGDTQRRLFGAHLAGLVAGHPARTVVEIGAGAGLTAEHLAPGTRWVAVEPNVHFHPHLRRAAQAYGLDLEIVAAGAEAMPLASGQADLVVSSHVLCSVDDVPAVLAEVRRVLRPGGRFAFVEHVGAEPGTLLRRLQRAVRRPWGWVADGCRPDRDTGAAIRAAGFARVEAERLRVPLGLVSPHVVGWAEA